MLPKEFLSLLSAYGYQKQEEDRTNHRTRFRHDENGFVDVWDGRKGITVGVYDVKAKIVRFKKRVASAAQLEDVITSV